MPSPTAETLSTPPPVSASHSALDWRAVVTALLFGLAAFVFFTRHHDFLYFCHTDEPGKVRQILTGDWNFHHPLLLLKSTRLAVALTGTAHAPQPVVEVGRSVSAFYAAAAIAALVLLAWSHGGSRAGVLVGVLLATHPVIFELAHYLKEDCSLLAGVAACFVGMEFYARRPTLARAVLVGAAAGLATAGKLIGLAVAVVALLVVLGTPRVGRRFDWKVAAVFVGAALIIFGTVHLKELYETEAMKHGLKGEFDRIDAGVGDQMSSFKIKYMSKFGSVISVPILLAAGFWILRRWRERRTLPPATWVLMVFPFVFAAALSVAPVSKERYLLPVYALFCVLGALGIVELAATRPFRHAKLTASLLAALAVGWQLPALLDHCREFSTDDRKDLCAWIRANLPPDAIIASDRRTHLDYAQSEGLLGDRLPKNRRPHRRYAAEFGTLAELHAQDVRYVAVCELDYHTVLRPNAKGKNARGREFRRFYEQLFAEGTLLWDRPNGRIDYLHPGLRLYEVP